MTNTLKVVAEKTGSLLDLKPTGRFYVVEEGQHETFKALQFCDEQGRVRFFDSKEAAEAAVANTSNQQVSHGYRICQIVDRDGQGWIALICGAEIVARFTNWTDARLAYRRAVK